MKTQKENTPLVVSRVFSFSLFSFLSLLKVYKLVVNNDVDYFTVPFLVTVCG